MSAAHEEDPDRPAATTNQPELAFGVAPLSALEEAVRLALESASREQVIQRVLTVLPDSAPAPEAAPPQEAGPQPGLHGKVQKVSVSLPTELTEAVRTRTGAGGFSRYVTDAVQERVRLDLLEDLSAELEAEFGPVSPDQITKAMAEWPDYEQQ